MPTVSFHKEGTGEKTLVLLHGWPGTSEKWRGVVDLLKGHYTIYSLDLPGWGKTPLTRAYTLSDYVTDVKRFIAEQKIREPIIVGHSFGGRIAIKMLSEDPVFATKLVLIGSAGIERKSLVAKYLLYIKPLVPQFLKNFLRPLVGSPDYLATKGIKRETFVSVISENLEPLLTRITTPTLLLWGEDDHTTPLWQGSLMVRLIPHARLIIISHGDHGIHYRRPEEVARFILEFV